MGPAVESVVGEVPWAQGEPGEKHVPVRDCRAVNELPELGGPMEILILLFHTFYLTPIARSYFAIQFAAKIVEKY